MGLGTFLLLNLYLSREVLLAQFQSVGTKTQANIFLFDIQPDQKTDVAEIVRAAGMPIIQEAPIVTMRLTEIKGRKTVDILADPQRKIRDLGIAAGISQHFSGTIIGHGKNHGRPLDRASRLSSRRRRPDFAREDARERFQRHDR